MKVFTPVFNTVFKSTFPFTKENRLVFTEFWLIETWFLSVTPVTKADTVNCGELTVVPVALGEIIVTDGFTQSLKNISEVIVLFPQALNNSIVNVFLPGTRFILA